MNVAVVSILALTLNVIQGEIYPKPAIKFKNLYADYLPNYKPKLKLTSRILGASEAKPHSIPSIAVLIIRSLNFTSFCGGNIISTKCILTAAHCLEGAIHAFIILGAHDLSTHGNTVFKLESTEFHIHPNWSTEEYVNDIGIISLREPIKYTPCIQCIPLPGILDHLRNDYAGRCAIIAGWGYTNGMLKHLQVKLLNSVIKIMSGRDCVMAYGSRIKKSNICTSGKLGTGTCQGDSGGPLIVDGILVGITSYGLKNCPPGSISVFTRITSYLSFIHKFCDHCNQGIH